MFRETIHANTSTNVESVMSQLRAKCADAGVAQPISDVLLTQTRELLSSLIEHGRNIAAVGSQMHVTRDLAGDGYSIKVIFRQGDRRSFLERLVDRLRGK